MVSNAQKDPNDKFFMYPRLLQILINRSLQGLATEGGILALQDPNVYKRIKAAKIQYDVNAESDILLWLLNNQIEVMEVPQSPELDVEDSDESDNEEESDESDNDNDDHQDGGTHVEDDNVVEPQRGQEEAGDDVKLNENIQMIEPIENVEMIDEPLHVEVEHDVEHVEERTKKEGEFSYNDLFIDNVLMMFKQQFK